MKKLIYLLFVAVLLSSCEKKSIDGHWHFRKIHDRIICDDPSANVFILDIKGDSAIWNNSQVMVHNRREQCLETIDTHRGITKFKYHWDNDSLFITDTRYDMRYCAASDAYVNCDKQSDAFIEIDVDINLPILSDISLAQEQDKKKSLATNIYLGEPKENFMICFPALRFWINGYYTDVRDLKIITDKRKIKVPENYRDDLYFQIYADKETKLEHIVEVIRELERIGISQIYLVGRADTNLQESFKPKNIKVTLNDFTNLNQNQSVAKYAENLR